LEPGLAATNGDAAAELLVRLGTALLESGAAVHVVERTLSDVAGHLGQPLQILVRPTNIAAVAGPPEHQRVSLVQCEVGSPNITRLAQLSAIADELRAGTLNAAEALRRVEAACRPQPPASPLAVAVLFGILALATSILLDGGWPELAASTVGGFVAGLVVGVATRQRPGMPLVSLFAAAAATIVGIAASAVIGPFATNIAIAAALISIDPGYSLFLGTTEIARQRTAAGTERFVGAVGTLFELGAGVAVGSAFMALAPRLANPVAAVRLPEWMLVVALGCYVLALYLGMNARRQDLGWLTVSLLAGAVGVSLGKVLPNAQVATFVAAFLVGAVGQLTTRWVALPGALLVLPGLRFLLPGSLAFTGVLHLLVENVSGGVEVAVQVLLTLVLLTTGLLVAGFVFPPYTPKR
jgi:uncharacterized membrane protein YjjP (DUF1212 family)